MGATLEASTGDMSTDYSLETIAKKAVVSLTHTVRTRKVEV